MNTYKVLVVVALFFCSATITDAFSGAGAGTVGNPYQITTCDQLQEMSADLAASYQLQNNIDCTVTAGWNSGRGFVPVGSSTAAFTGNFNGRNFTIDSLYIERADDVYGENIDDAIDEDHVGLFGLVNGALIRNVRLTNAYVKGYQSVGGVVGEAQNSTLENLQVNMGVAADAQNDCDPKACIWARFGFSGGGVVGMLINSEATRLSAGGAVKGSGNNIGGVVGTMDDSNLTHATSTARIDGGYYIGGLVGAMNGNSELSYGVATGDVVGYEAGELSKNGQSIGGLVGAASGAGIEIRNSFATGNVSGQESIGGLIGHFVAGEVSDSFATGNVTASSSIVGGLLGYLSGAVITDSYATGDVEGYEQVGGLAGLMRDSVVSDVSATGDVNAINFFAGGLVGVMEDSNIENASAGGEVIALAGVSGGLVAVMDASSSVTDSSATGDVSGAGASGGFVSMACGGSSVTASYATGDVFADQFAGGFLGYHCEDLAFGLSGGVTMDGVYATGNVTANIEYAGGFASRVVNSVINNAYAAGSVEAPEFVGGFAAEYTNSTSSNIYARGILTAPISASIVGGLIATSSNASVTNSVWDSEASGVETSAAGVGLSTTDMKTTATYMLQGWNFSSIWGINSTNNNSYPFLRFQGFTHDSSYTAPTVPAPPVSSSGGGGGGGSKSRKSQATTQPTDVKDAASVPVSDQIRDFVLRNRAVFEAAIRAGITLPPFITTLLDTSTSTVPVVGLPVRDLAIGMSGEDVKSLQRLLIDQGHSISAGATGLFGAQTKTALAAYQTKAGLVPAQGYFGPITRAQMKKAGLTGLWW